MRHHRPDWPPELGRIVLYRSSHPAAAVVPAVIVATVESARAYPSADSDAPKEGHVHLVQFSPAASQQLGATYVARDVPEDSYYAGRGQDFAAATDGYYTEDEHTPGSWRWPIIRGA